MKWWTDSKTLKNNQHAKSLLFAYWAILHAFLLYFRKIRSGLLSVKQVESKSGGPNLGPNFMQKLSAAKELQVDENSDLTSTILTWDKEDQCFYGIFSSG